MKTKEVSRICGVDSSTITRAAKKVGIILENGKSHDFTDDEIKKIQARLMQNGFNRGNASTKEGVVENEAMHAFKGGLSLQIIMQSGNLEACKELCQMITEGTQAQHDLMIAEQQNKRLQLENQQQAHALKYDKVKEWTAWSELKKTLSEQFEEFRHRISFKSVIEAAGLTEGDDYEKIVRGLDKFPTLMISPSGEDKILDWCDDHLYSVAS